MRAGEERRRTRLQADRELVVAAARELRHRAVQGAYAGARGQDVGLALAAVMDGVAIHLDTVPVQVRSDVLAAARAIVNGPDGPNDPRGGTVPPLSAGDGF